MAFIGQLNFYLNEQVKDVHDEPSIGSLLCRSKEKLTVEYSLKGGINQLVYHLMK